MSAPAPEVRWPCAAVIRGVGFDFYGTLAELDRPARTAGEVFEAHGVRCPDELIRLWSPDGFDGCTTPSHRSRPGYDDWRLECLARLARHCGAPSSLAATIAGEVVEEDRRNTVRAIAGARDVLLALGGLGLALGLASNWNYAMHPYLEQAGLSGFSVIVSSADVGARKPHPLLFEELLHGMGQDASACLYVGDTWSTDVVGALRAGLRPIWINREGAANPLAGHVLEVRRLTEVPDLLRRLA